MLISNAAVGHKGPHGLLGVSSGEGTDMDSTVDQKESAIDGTLYLGLKTNIRYSITQFVEQEARRLCIV